jgi:hypothetical protein
MMASKDSYLLEVMVEKENNVFPMIPNRSSSDCLWNEKHIHSVYSNNLVY